MLNHNIKIDNEHIVVVNNSKSWLKVIYNDYFKNYTEYVSTLESNMYSASPYCGDEMRVYINESNDNLYCYKVLKEKGVITLHRVGVVEDYNFNNKITLVTGHSGGGTSIVVKALKCRGIYFGDDSGDVSRRKNHEAQGISMWLKSFDFKKYISQEKLKFLQIADTYKYNKGKINAFKVTDISDNIIKLNDIFTNLKVISIIREQNKFYSTIEGEAFNSKPKERVIQNQIFRVEGVPLFHLDFKKFFTDYKYFNKVLTFLECKNLLEDNGELGLLKKEIKFDGKVLE